MSRVTINIIMAGDSAKVLPSGIEAFFIDIADNYSFRYCSTILQPVIYNYP